MTTEVATTEHPSPRETSPMIEVCSPATGERIGEVPVFSEREVKQAVERARVAQRSWAARPVEERAERALRRRWHVDDVHARYGVR